VWLRLRQIALVARELKPVQQDLEQVLGLAVCFNDPGVGHFGLENALFPVGNQIIEVVAPIQENTAGGRYLDRRKGDGGYMVITQCDDHPPRRARVEQLGIRIVGQFDDEGFTDIQLHPADTGGSFLEIDQQEGGEALDGRWSPAGPDWHQAVRTDVVSAITGAELQCDDPDRVAARWSEIVEIPTESRDGVPTLPLQNAGLRFVPVADGRGEGLGGIDLAVVDGERLRAAATARNLLAADGTHVLLGGVRMYLPPNG
jgi:hypothetical protein